MNCSGCFRFSPGLGLVTEQAHVLFSLVCFEINKSGGAGTIVHTKTRMKELHGVNEADDLCLGRESRVTGFDVV